MSPSHSVPPKMGSRVWLASAFRAPDDTLPTDLSREPPQAETGRRHRTSLLATALHGVGSLDDLIGAQQQRWRDGEAERLGGLEIDHQLEFRRLLDGQIAGNHTLENSIYVVSGTAKQVSNIQSVGHQATRINIRPERVHRRQPLLDRKIREAS